MAEYQSKGLIEGTGQLTLDLRPDPASKSWNVRVSLLKSSQPERSVQVQQSVQRICWKPTEELRDYMKSCEGKNVELDSGNLITLLPCRCCWRICFTHTSTERKFWSPAIRAMSPTKNQILADW